MSETMPVSDFEYPQAQVIRTKNLPYVKVVEQPSPHALRFRYECERRYTGCIIGENSTPENKTYPTIQVHGYRGPAAIIISCVTKDDPPKPHPHSLVGRDSCQNGICSMKINLLDGPVSFSNLGIQCVKKKQVKDALNARKHEQVDPFRTGFEHINFPDTIDLNVVRLCFQVFIQGSERKFNVPLKPVVSGLIYDKKASDELIICKLSLCSAPVSGGTEVVLLCGKITKDDIQVRFFEMRDNWLFWESYGDFLPIHVHKQVAIVFKTPMYCNQDIIEPVTVYIQLRRKSDGSTSKPLPFLMLPLDIDDVNSLKRKRMKFDNNPRSYLCRQMQTQTEKQSSMLNQALLFNFIAPNFEAGGIGGGIVSRPSPIFQDQASAHPDNLSYHNNQVSVERRAFNVPLNQQNHPEEQDCAQVGSEASVPQLRIASQVNGSSQPQALSLPLQSQPRRRTEPPPPNVTIHSYAYREPMSTKHRQQESSRYLRCSFHQQTEMEANKNDPFELNDLPCNFDQLSPQDLAVLGTTNSDNISESLSENLSKGLSISDQIQDTLQNIQELNRDVEATWQQGRGKFLRNSEGREQSVVGSSFNDFPSQDYESHIHQFGAGAGLFS